MPFPDPPVCHRPDVIRMGRQDAKRSCAAARRRGSADAKHVTASERAPITAPGSALESNRERRRIRRR